MNEIVNIKCGNCGQNETKITIKNYPAGRCKVGKCVYCLNTTLFECIEPNPNFVHTSIKPTVHCPFCQSTDCKKISAASKIGKIAMWGVLAAGSVGKTWHCNSCGSNFG